MAQHISEHPGVQPGVQPAQHRSFAVIGCGARAAIGKHINALDAAASVDFAVDPSVQGRERARELFGAQVQTFSNLTDLLQSLSFGNAAPGEGKNQDKPQLAGAIVATPDDTHAQVAGQLLAAGVPVYLEKPMSITLEDSDALLDAAKKTGTKLYVGHNMRHMAVVRQMKQIIAEGLIGKVKAIWCRHFVGNGGDYYFKDWHAQREKSGTLLLQKGAHDIDVIHYLASGSSEFVQGLGELMVYGSLKDRRDNSDKIMPQWFSYDNWPPASLKEMNPIIDVEDISMIQMRLDNGVLASYQQCHFTPDYWRNYTVIGDAGRLENFGDSQGGVVRVWNKRHAYAPNGDLEFPITGDEGGHGDADRLTMAEFLSFLAGGDTVTSALAARNAVATAVTGAACIRQANLGLPVPRAL